ncbi:alpha/beta hydrolase [Halobacteriovorax sp. HLS]|uniref:alpha/beta hydrolase n=1 Tax=Halobacteriovorax sp. HLS TaxID=2234000 RepID=UPI0013E3BE9C|nr:alpha/beta hydrolase [Halobacteriovorax sp. HLS]
MFSSKVLDSTFLPAKFSGPVSSTKIMILMHGIGDNKNSYVDIANELNQTCLDFLLVNAPKPYLFGFSWYDLPPGNPIEGIHNSIDLIEELINELTAHGYKNEDIFIAGFSQGGCIAIHSFLKLKRKFAGVICLSPRIYLERMEYKHSDILSETPIFIAHGQVDQAIPFKDVEQQTLTLLDDGLDIEWHEYHMGHEIDIEEIQHLRKWLIKHF